MGGFVSLISQGKESGESYARLVVLQCDPNPGKGLIGKLPLQDLDPLGANAAGVLVCRRALHRLDRTNVERPFFVGRKRFGQRSASAETDACHHRKKPPATWIHQSSPSPRRLFVERARVMM